MSPRRAPAPRAPASPSPPLHALLRLPPGWRAQAATSATTCRPRSSVLTLLPSCAAAAPRATWRSRSRAASPPAPPPAPTQWTSAAAWPARCACMAWCRTAWVMCGWLAVAFECAGCGRGRGLLRRLARRAAAGRASSAARYCRPRASQVPVAQVCGKKCGGSYPLDSKDNALKCANAAGATQASTGDERTRQRAHRLQLWQRCTPACSRPAQPLAAAQRGMQARRSCLPDEPGGSAAPELASLSGIARVTCRRLAPPWRAPPSPPRPPPSSRSCPRPRWTCSARPGPPSERAWCSPHHCSSLWLAERRELRPPRRRGLPAAGACCVAGRRGGARLAPGASLHDRANLPAWLLPPPHAGSPCTGEDCRRPVGERV